MSLKNNFIRVDIITLVFFLTGAIRIKILYFLQLFARVLECNEPLLKDLKYLLERICQNLYLLLHGKKAPAGFQFSCLNGTQRNDLYLIILRVKKYQKFTRILLV